MTQEKKMIEGKGLRDRRRMEFIKKLDEDLNHTLGCRATSLDSQRRRDGRNDTFQNRRQKGTATVLTKGSKGERNEQAGKGSGIDWKGLKCEQRDIDNSVNNRRTLESWLASGAH